MADAQELRLQPLPEIRHPPAQVMLIATLEGQATQERQRADQERQRAAQERQRVERLAAKLRELGG